MIAELISLLAGLIIAVISTMGYGGIVVCMIIESACIPLPSEIIMPFSGYLVSVGRFSLWGTALAGAVGNVIGSLLAYAAGKYLGRDFIYEHGKYLLISKRDLKRAEGWFEKYGSAAIFTSRLLPVVRTFISLPAGIARMKVVPFSVYTFLGSIPWCYGLAWIGLKTGENWNTLGKYFHKFDFVIGIFILFGVVFWVRRHFKMEAVA